MLQHRRYQKDLTRCSLSGCLMLIPKLVTGSVLPISSDGFPASFPILKKYYPSWYTHNTSLIFVINTCRLSLVHQSLVKVCFHCTPTRGMKSELQGQLVAESKRFNLNREAC